MVFSFDSVPNASSPWSGGRNQTTESVPHFCRRLRFSDSHSDLLSPSLFIHQHQKKRQKWRLIHTFGVAWHLYIAFHLLAHFLSHQLVIPSPSAKLRAWASSWFGPRPPVRKGYVRPTHLSTRNALTTPLVSPLHLPTSSIFSLSAIDSRYKFTFSKINCIWFWNSQMDFLVSICPLFCIETRLTGINKSMILVVYEFVRWKYDKCIAFFVLLVSAKANLPRSLFVTNVIWINLNLVLKVSKFYFHLSI